MVIYIHTYIPIYTLHLAHIPFACVYLLLINVIMIWVQNRVIVLSKRLHLDFKEVSCKSNFNRNYSLTITELCLMLICRVSI